MNKTWKKIVVIMTAFSMVLSLCACGNNEAEETAQNVEENAENENIESVKDTEWAQEWLKSNDYLTYPGWEVAALRSLYNSNGAKFEMDYIGKTYAVTGVIGDIESDHIKLGVADLDYDDSVDTSYYISVYLPVEELVNLSFADSITVAGELTKSKFGENKEDNEDNGITWHNIYSATFECFAVMENAEIYIPCEETEYTVGDTITTDDFEITLDTAEYASNVDIDVSSENFCLPTDDGLHITGNDYEILTFSFTYRFTGDENLNYYGNMCCPIIYSDYSAVTDYVILFDNYAEGEWNILGTSMSDSFRKSSIISSVDNNIFRSFNADESQKTVTARGFIFVQSEMKNDSSSKHILYLPGFEAGFVI